MKTNVSIKFNSIEEYREIEKKLEELGYVNDKEWNEIILNDVKLEHMRQPFVWISPSSKNFFIHNHDCKPFYTYNSLEEFLKDE